MVGFSFPAWIIIKKKLLETAIMSEQTVLKDGKLMLSSCYVYFV